MGVRLSFGKGPLRVTVPLTSGRGLGSKSYHAIARFSDGSEYKCHHNHQTEQAAVSCAQKYRRDRTAGKAVPPLTKKPKEQKKSTTTSPDRRGSRGQSQDELRARVRTGLENVAKTRGRVEEQIEILKQSVAKLDGHMQASLEAGREDLAKEASRRKVVLQKQLMDLESNYELLSAEQANLEAAARKLA